MPWPQLPKWPTGREFLQGISLGGLMMIPFIALWMWSIKSCGPSPEERKAKQVQELERKLKELKGGN